MNCKYCNQPTEDRLNACIKECNSCRATFYFYRSPNSPTPHTIQLKHKEYLIELDFDEQVCQLWYPGPFHDSYDTYLVQLDYIPDINPTNINRWLERLLNLKAFL